MLHVFFINQVKLIAQLFRDWWSIVQFLGNSSPLFFLPTYRYLCTVCPCVLRHRSLPTAFTARRRLLLLPTAGG
jgi:hypothetical protein